LDDFEQRIQQQGFVQPVLANLQHRISESDIEIIGWDASLREHFCQLNLQWLQEFFNGELTDHDERALFTPESYYLAKGGYIWFARCNQEIVGCVALANQGNGLFEISKMGVGPNMQGFGIGRKLLLTALNKAREVGIKEVYLESSTKLNRAIRLYRNLGFREVPHPNGQSIYPRSDIYMTLTL
jgi:ribosomal protein S18 acetylase RimI-like enzyme